jgi:hypothetical protein
MTACSCFMVITSSLLSLRTYIVYLKSQVHCFNAVSSGTYSGVGFAVSFHTVAFPQLVSLACVFAVEIRIPF